MLPVTPADALTEVLARVGAATDGLVVLGALELQQWPADAVAALKGHGVLRRAKPGDTAACPGCERACVMPVLQRVRAGGSAAHFIACDKRDDISRVPLAEEHLERWRVDGRTLGDALAVLLGGSACQPVPSQAGLLRLGHVTGQAGRDVAHLRLDGQGRVFVDVAGHALDLGLVLALKGGRLVLDTRYLARCVDAPAAGAALHAETPEQRTQRLAARRTALKQQGVKAFLGVISREEGVSVSMVKKILGRAVRPTEAPVPAWAASLASWQGVPPASKRKR